MITKELMHVVFVIVFLMATVSCVAYLTGELLGVYACKYVYRWGD